MKSACLLLGLVLLAPIALGSSAAQDAAVAPAVVPVVSGADMADEADGEDERDAAESAADSETHGAAEGDDSHAADAVPDAPDVHDAHASVDRSGDANLFGELFAHLVPHPVTALWFGGDKGFGTVLPYAADANGHPLEGSAEHPLMFHSSAELTEHYAKVFDGGFGMIIFNINTVMWVAGLLMLALFIPMKRKAVALAGKAPRGGTLYGMLEPLVLFIRDEMVYAIMGKERGRRFVPLFLTMFFFILMLNLLGLVYIGALGGTATANLAVTAGLATVTLIWIHLSGLREHGPIQHIKNFIPHGIPWFAVPIIAVVEAIGVVVKPFALTVRLFANMTAGHLIVLALFGLIYYFASYVLALPILGMAVGIYALELFVAFVQAYVFTYLSILFVGASVHPEH
ncbi:MAG: F-type H+-transporting ATPase subunit a [Pseudohongiellaceae bacterium]|jgi:F-type H+-transporting ATPase subunit a